LLDVHQNVRIESRCRPPPLLSVAVSDRRVADLLDAVGAPYVGDVMTKLERARVSDDSLKAVVRWLILVHCPGRKVELLREVDVLLVFRRSTCAVAETHELDG
jgi:hypothetical protein